MAYEILLTTSILISSVLLAILISLFIRMNGSSKKTNKKVSADLKKIKDQIEEK
tara:strand:+ start:3967 stop:4128 length:162 start_codon:yes stop_codon:yes gene_type:complete